MKRIILFCKRKYSNVLKIFIIILIFCLIYFVTFFRINNSKITSFKYFPTDLNCDNLFKSDGDKNLILYAEKWNKTQKFVKDFDLTENIDLSCSKFIKDNHYLVTTSDDEEREFGVAFSVVTFRSAVQVERLLRTIYRPWNYYCIHVDKKAQKEFFDAIEQLTECLYEKFGNIVNTRNRVDVQWGTMTVLTADLNCMKELYDRYGSWKYLINLTGQEFPLKTNKELVQILKAYKGANNIEGTYKRRNEDRVPTTKMPFPIIWYKGSVHITANRDFIKYIFESWKAKTILNQLKGHSVPDEQFFATLNFNPNLRIPGSYIGDLDEGVPTGQTLHYFLTRFKNWGEYSCLSGKVVSAICIWGVRDLPKLVEAKHLFANKFYEDFQPATLQCLEKWYYDKFKNEEYTGKAKVDKEYYKSLIFVKNQFKPLYL